MRTFSLHPVVLIALIALLVVSFLLLLVVAPVVLVNWLWNAFIAQFSGLPLIGVFQAGLLYVALLCVFYICDLVHIEFKVEKIN